MISEIMGLLLIDSYGISVEIISFVGTINQVYLKNLMLIAFLLCVLQVRTYARFIVYSGVPRNFVLGGVQQIQLRTEGRGIWGR